MSKNSKLCYVKIHDILFLYFFLSLPKNKVNNKRRNATLAAVLSTKNHNINKLGLDYYIYIW